MCDAKKFGKSKASQAIPHYLAGEAFLIYNYLPTALIREENPEDILNAIGKAIPTAGRQEKSRKEFFQRKYQTGESVLMLAEDLRNLSSYAFPSTEHGELATQIQESQVKAQLLSALPQPVREALRLRNGSALPLGELIHAAEDEVARFEGYNDTSVNAVQPERTLQRTLLSIQRQLANLNPFIRKRRREPHQTHQDQRKLLHNRLEWRRPTEPGPSHWDAQEPQYDDEYDDEDHDADDYSEDPYEDDYQEDQEDYEEYDEEEDD
ncbi:unnamed protein product [Bursaphelenchus xylophilus]|uniref:(pine wood nematode) hypothetical protein n=1 Tax=Bursaphelenchus xylophilus TaxID=6326 RepID=A0A1I7SIR3_BURXY|nr:unnamed protein product [Bursaphelenchus xylophilus]CAG9118916.1 unnamed protein product [Bursaphelenchus xylophilus]